MGLLTETPQGFEAEEIARRQAEHQKRIEFEIGPEGRYSGPGTGMMSPNWVGPTMKSPDWVGPSTQASSFVGPDMQRPEWVGSGPQRGMLISGTPLDFRMPAMPSPESMPRAKTWLESFMEARRLIHR